MKDISVKNGVIVWNGGGYLAGSWDSKFDGRRRIKNSKSLQLTKFPPSFEVRELGLYREERERFLLTD